MSNFKINLRKESFYINEGDSVIGDICFSIDDWFFPDKNWDDFVVLLICWLAKQTIELNFDTTKTVYMRFMEGCFKISLELEKENPNECTIRFIEGEKIAGDEEVIHKTITVPFEEVKKEVKKACKLLIHMKETKELDFEEEFEDLKESYELLCKG